MLPRPPVPEAVDIDAAFTDLAQVAVRTSAHGSWQENACFLLGSASGAWRIVPFSHPAAGRLTSRLRGLPGFDDDRLLDVIGSRKSEIVILWRHRTPAGSDR